MATATKTKSTKSAAVEATETVAPSFEVFTEVPKRAYTMTRTPAHAAFFEAVRAANKGKASDKRVFLKFPAPSKGVSAAIKDGRYTAIQAGEFTAQNRTIDGVLQVFVTVADKA